MKTKYQYPFTVAEYLSSSGIEPSDADISSALNLMKKSEGCVPREEIGDDVLQPIRRKFSAVFEIAIELADAELEKRGLKPHTDFNFCLVIDPSFDADTHVAVLDYDKPFCYLHEWCEARTFAFANLSELAKAVLSAKVALVNKVTDFQKKEISVLLESGVVHSVVDVPPGMQLTILDSDTEGVEKERIEVSPLDGELCVISKFIG